MKAPEIVSEFMREDPGVGGLDIRLGDTEGQGGGRAHRSYVGDTDHAAI
jgi:hypothetical protein